MNKHGTIERVLRWKTHHIYFLFISCRRCLQRSMISTRRRCWERGARTARSGTISPSPSIDGEGQEDSLRGREGRGHQGKATITGGWATALCTLSTSICTPSNTCVHPWTLDYIKTLFFIPYSRKIWWFGGLYYNCQNFLLAYTYVWWSHTESSNLYPPIQRFWAQPPI